MQLSFTLFRNPIANTPLSHARVKIFTETLKPPYLAGQWGQDLEDVSHYFRSLFWPSVIISLRVVRKLTLLQKQRGFNFSEYFDF
jgi:hypothetical protein